MSLITPTIGAGTTIGNGPVSGSITPLANLVDVKWPKYAVGKVDTSNAANTNKVKTFISGWIEPGEWEFKIQYGATETISLNAQRGVMKSWLITIPDGSTTGTTLAFNGFIVDVDGEIPVIENKLIENTFKVQLSGDILITAGT